MKHKTCTTCSAALQRDEVFTGVCMTCRLGKDEKEKKGTKAGKPASTPSSGGPAAGAVKKDIPAQPPAGPSSQRPETILLIDDDPFILKMLESRLKASGYTVLTSEDGEAGYHVIKELRPDLIVSDVLMPKMTGYDLLQKLKKETDGTQNIPVLILTAKGSMKDFFSGWEIHGFMVKPVKAEELLAKIQDLLRTAQLRKQKGLL